jgi:hypothetical protein
VTEEAKAVAHLCTPEGLYLPEESFAGGLMLVFQRDAVLKYPGTFAYYLLLHCVDDAGTVPRLEVEEEVLQKALLNQENALTLRYAIRDVLRGLPSAIQVTSAPHLALVLSQALGYRVDYERLAVV